MLMICRCPMFLFRSNIPLLLLRLHPLPSRLRPPRSPFQGSQVLTGLRELSFLHTLSNVPVDEGSLGIHQVKLVVKTSPGLSDGGGVAQHAHSTLHLCQITSWYNSWWLVVDADFESSWKPVDKLDGPLGLHCGNGSIHSFGYHVSSVQHAAGHVLSMTGSHFTIWLAGSNQALVISATVSCSW